MLQNDVLLKPFKNIRAKKELELRDSCDESIKLSMFLRASTENSRNGSVLSLVKLKITGVIFRNATSIGFKLNDSSQKVFVQTQLSSVNVSVS